MAITQDELKHLTKLNAAIGARKWTQGYDIARALGNPPPGVTHLDWWREQYQTKPMYFKGVEIVWDPAEQQSLDL